jgi:hypothetical protein
MQLESPMEPVRSKLCPYATMSAHSPSADQAKQMAQSHHTLLQYRSQVTWQTSASSEEVTLVAWTFTRKSKWRAQRVSSSTHALAHIHMHSRVRIGHGPIIASTRRWWQDRDSMQFARLSYFLMNTCELDEQREVVKDSLGVDKLPIRIFSWWVSSTRERDREHCPPPTHETFGKL